ncbi:MAG: DMT family transporter [Treponema sp.]|jgi:drug/metabolite transporter (DMT)-like permease|nr:DMT family transporter [Treponema sp.]
MYKDDAAMERRLPIISILTAGCLWGLMGIFTREMTAAGFDLSDTLIVRCSVACAAFGLTLLIRDKRLFRIKLRHVGIFAGAGICSMLFFTYSYFQCISITSLSTAAILLYTSPSMVMLMSLFIFRERLTAIKIAALAMAFAGCVLVSGGGGGNVTVRGVVYGLCAGFGYALYSIFARLLLNRGYDSRTVNFYAMLFAFAGACFIWGCARPMTLMFSSGTGLLWSLCAGLVSCYLPYLLYTFGMTKVETGKASVMASTEPVVATLMGALIYKERMPLVSVFGVLLVIGAVCALNLNYTKRKISLIP